MDYLFYCTPERIHLLHLTECLLAHGFASSIVTPTPTKAIVYHLDTWFQVDELLPPFSDRFEEAQCAVLREFDSQSVFQLSFRVSLLENILPHLQAVLATYDGWIGVDDGSFSARFDLAHMDDVPAALHSLLVSTDDDGG